MFRALSLLVLGFLCACASTGSGSGDRLSTEEGSPARVSFVDYRSGIRMTLVNEAHTDPVELYSEVRTNANTKVVSNEVMEAMIEHFDEQGFGMYAQRGFAPATGRGGEVQSFEMDDAGETRFLVTHGGQSGAADAFRKCRTAFLQIQELTMQAQAVRNDGNQVIFEQPKLSTKKQKN